MSRTLEQVHHDVMELNPDDRAALIEELTSLPTDPMWRRAWSDESDRRLQRVKREEESVLTLDEFWSDDEP